MVKSIFIFIAVLLIGCLVMIALRKRKAIKAQKKQQQEEERLALERKLTETAEQVKKTCVPIAAFLNKSLLAEDHYFTFSEKILLEEDSRELLNQLKFLKTNGRLATMDNDIQDLFLNLTSLDNVRTNHNQSFVTRELKNNKEFFDTILDYPLDQQQRESIVKQEDNCLVISSAGSGKTSTMMGKLLYLVQQRGVEPSRILTITYTHKASEELTQRLLGTGLSCMTFHKLAMTIVNKVEGGMPSLADPNMFSIVFYDMLKDVDFKEAVLEYLTNYKSLTKDEHDYTDSVEYYKDRRKYGIMALYPDMDGKLICTKSEEERKICSYLTELGVNFKYEEPYEHQTLTEEYRQYKPDFSIYFKDANGKECRLYLEHYAINANGKVPQWFGGNKTDGWYTANQRYLEGIEWKKRTHKEYGTILISTTSADFHTNTIRTRLRNLLLEAGVPIHELTADELMDKVMSRNKNLENALLQMTQSFVNLVKANGKTVDDIKQMAQKKKSYRDVFVIERVMKPLFNRYQKELENRKELDFTDLILKATEYCKEGKWMQRYDYILIDEFQDISVDRYHFLLSLRTELPKTKLYCVGDDWQSIYRFSGSDMSLFSKFSDYFGYTEECKIETTYRFGNPLVNESSQFVQHNPLQKHKMVIPRAVNAPVTKLSFMGYEDNKELQSLVKRMIARVPAEKSVYIISRYSYDVKSLSAPDIVMHFDQNTDMVKLNIAGRDVKFMTIHGSKGLEADYVFVLNCNSGLYGFPSLVSDDPVLDYVLSDSEHYEYAEERRVFYVGITRAKVHTVVLYNKNTPSPFVTEMDNAVSDNPNPCPWCGIGHRVLKYEGWTKQKTPYRVWGCDNQEANCQYFEREFSNHQYMELKGKTYHANNG